MARIRNLSGIDEHALKSYSITSASGSLAAGAWTSMQDQSIDDPTPANKNNGDGWEEMGVPGSNQLAEGYLIGNSLISPGENVSLGSIFRRPGADFNNSASVNAADLTQWKSAFGVNGTGDSELDGDSDGADFLAWQRGFGGTPLAANPDLSFVYTLEDGNLVTGAVTYTSAQPAVNTVPEPTAVQLVAVVAIVAGLALRKRSQTFSNYAPLTCGVVHQSTPATKLPRRGAWLASASLTMSVMAASAFGVVLNDRDYQLGDDSLEHGVAGQFVGNISYDSSGPSGAYLDLTVSGDPKYASVVTRPGATAGKVGIAFDGGGDRLSTTVSMNLPTQMWDNSVFFPALDYPLNYENIYAHGIQLWAKPTLPVAGTEQDLVIDTLQQGILITSTGTWGLLHAGTVQSSAVTVSSTVDANGWVHVMQLGGGRDVKLGRSQNGGALLVNGIAVAASAANIAADSSKLSIGSNQAGDNNFYNGTLDDVRLFLWGSNPTQTNGGQGPNGMNYGTLDLGNDNDWIKRKLADLQVTSRADVNLDKSVVGNGLGSPASDDVAAFVANWGYRQVINGLTVGDWNSRQHGDLNYDGAVDLQDAMILHNGLIAAGGMGLDFALLNNVPEPSSASIVVIGLLALARAKRQRSRGCVGLLNS